MNLAPLAIQKFFANNGRPLAGGLLFTYVAGTTTKIATYPDSSGVSPNANPIVLDFRGECRIWLDPQLQYKFTLAPRGDTDPPTNPIWTVDDITASPMPFDNAAIDTGPVNNIELSIPRISSPVAFTRILFKANNTNTGPATISINGGPAADLTWQNLENFGGGEIQDNGFYEAVYDGTEWQLLGPALQPPQMTTLAEVTSGADAFIVAWSYPVGHFERYGADPTGIADSTDAINAACEQSSVQTFIGRQPAFCSGGDFRVDGTIVVDDYGSCYLNGGRLIRRSASTANTDAVLHLKGTNAVFDGGGGSIWTENESPSGVVACGHSDATTSNYNSLRWRFANCLVYPKDFGGSGAIPYPGAQDGIGVLIPSSQPELGSSFVNYFGTLENITVEGATTAYMFTDLANGMNIRNCTFRGIFHYGFLFHGSYGNVLQPGFCEIGYGDSVIAVFLSTKLYPLAPFASSLESSRNWVSPFAFETGFVSNVGIRNEAGCQFNRGSILFNASGTPIIDADGANDFDSDQARSTNKTLAIVAGNVSEVFSIDGVHSTGTYARIKTTATTFAFIGSATAISGAGTKFDLEIAAGSTRSMYLSIAGAGAYYYLSIARLGNFANDAAAAAGGVPVNGLYRNGSVIMIRVV